MADEKKHIDMPPDREHLDFLTAIILLVVSVAAIILSLGYWRRPRRRVLRLAGVHADDHRGVPARDGGDPVCQFPQGQFRIRAAQPARRGASRTLHSQTFWRAVIGLAIFAVYIFGMLGRLPFWLASFLVLFAILLYLNLEGKAQLKPVLKLLLIAALSVAGIVLLFQVAFSVPMP